MQERKLAISGSTQCQVQLNPDANRLTRILALTLLLLATFSSVVSNPAKARGIETHAFSSLVNNESANTTDESDELLGMTLSPIDPGADPESVMRSRPFVVTESAYPTLMTSDGLSDRQDPRDRLVSFLYLRGVDQGTIDTALARYDDRTVNRIIPDDVLRAALLMLSGWDPYQSTIAAVLDGENPSGQPYGGVFFDHIGMDGAIATLYEDDATDQHLMIFDSSYDGELPEVLIPTMVHEALHGGGSNSAEEEIIANLLDSICWAELLSFDPDLAFAGTDLATFNNFKLVGLLNSSGRGGAAQVGVATSIFGDIYVGDGLEDFDSESLRATVESDWFYDSLKNVGSAGQQTTAALVKRFPGGAKLGEKPRYDERMLATIDSGVGKVVTPELATRLAALIGLQMVTSFDEGNSQDSLPNTAEDALGSRPFVPNEPVMFDPRSLQLAPKRPKAAAARTALESALANSPADDATKQDMLSLFDDPAVLELIPDGSLRAATLLLGAYSPWDLALAAIFEGENNDGVPLQVIFAPSRDSSPASRRSDFDGDGAPPAILVNSLYSGERIELLASIVFEATLLHDDTLVQSEAVAASTFGTLAYADFIAADPEIARADSWGTLQRNRMLLALLNSSGDEERSQGMLNGATSVEDVLLGVYADASSFENFVDRQPWGTRFDRQSELEAPEIFGQLLSNAGIDPPTGAGGIVTFSDAALIAVDAAVSVYLSPDDALKAAEAMVLGTGR